MATAKVDGTGFNPATTWGTIGWDDASRRRFADFNGDGKVDVLWINLNSSSLTVYLSNGLSFQAATYWGNIGWGDPARLFEGDFNGDGKADVVHVGTETNASLTVALSTGVQFAPARTWGSIGWHDYTRYTFGDVNGDGKTDAVFFDMDGAFWSANAAGQAAGNLLAEISNGIGGHTEIDYKPSTQYNNTLLPFPVQTVSSVTVCDNYASSACNGNSLRTDYAYDGGYHHIAERDFRGFNKVSITTTAPDGGSKTSETWFHQGNDTAVDQNTPSSTTGYMKGKPYKTSVKDGNNKI